MIPAFPHNIRIRLARFEINVASWRYSVSALLAVLILLYVPILKFSLYLASLAYNKKVPYLLFLLENKRDIYSSHEKFICNLLRVGMTNFLLLSISVCRNFILVCCLAIWSIKMTTNLKKTFIFGWNHLSRWSHLYLFYKSIYLYSSKNAKVEIDEHHHWNQTRCQKSCPIHIIMNVIWVIAKFRNFKFHFIFDFRFRFCEICRIGFYRSPLVFSFHPLWNI